MDKVFMLGGIAQKICEGLRGIGDVPSNDSRFTFARMLELADHIDQMSSAINALEERVKKLEGKEKKNV